MTRGIVEEGWRTFVFCAAALGVALGALGPGCKPARSSSDAVRSVTPQDLTLSGSPWTALDTPEGAGAWDVALIGLVIVNTHPTSDLTLTGMRVHGQGDTSVVNGLGVFLDADGDGMVSGPDSLLWAGGGFQGGVADAQGLIVPITSGVTTTLLVTCDIQGAAPLGSSFRAWVAAPDGDLTFLDGNGNVQPLGRATSGRRTVSGTGMGFFRPSSPKRRAFSDPGDGNLPTLAAHFRSTSVEGVRDLLFDLEGAGTSPGWTGILWSLWLDGDRDGARASPQDIPIAMDLTLQPGIPIPLAWPGPVAAGTGADLLITADIPPTAPGDGVYPVTLTLTAGTGTSSGAPVTLDGPAVEGGIRVGTRGMVVTAGLDLAIQDPDFGEVIAADPGPWNAWGGIALDPQGRWVAIGSHSPDQILLVDLRGLREIGRIQLLAYPVSLVVAPAGDKIYVSLGALRGVAEVILDVNLSGGTVSRYFLPGGIHGDLAISPGGDRIYLAQPHGVVQIVDTSTGLPVGALDGPEPMAIELFPGGDPLLVVSADGRLFSLPVGGLPAIATGLRGSDVAVAPDGSEVYLLTGGEVHLLDPVTFAFLDFRPYPGVGMAVTAGSWPGRAIVLDEDGRILTLDPGQLPRAGDPSIRLDVWAMDVVR